MATTSGGVKRVGRTLRRPRRGATNVSSNSSASNTSTALQPIEENTVVDLTNSSTRQHFMHSPEPIKPQTVKTEDAAAGGSKRKREASIMAESDAAPTRTRGRKQVKAKATKPETKDGGASAAAAELDRKTHKATVLLEELEKQLDQRCADLLAEAERKSEELRMELKVQLMFLPESVRAMPWKTFIEDFGGSLENVIQNVKEQDYINYVTSHHGLAAVSSPKSALKIRPVPSTVRSKDRRSNGNTPGLPAAVALGLSTPSASIRGSISNYQTPLCTPSTNIPSTVVRTARKGEMTYSIRGSPIAPGSMTKAPVGSLVATFQEDAEPLTSITLDNETALDLTNPELLNEETRAQARAKLEALQAKVNALLRQFK